MGPDKSNQRSKAHADEVSSKSTRAVRSIRVASESSSSESDPSGSKGDRDQRRLCASTVFTQVKLNEDHRMSHEEADLVELRDHGERSKACTHCGSIKHNYRGCWKILNRQKCGRQGHPSDKCFYACAACGKVHESDKCPLENLYNLMRK